MVGDIILIAGIVILSGGFAQAAALAAPKREVPDQVEVR